MRRLASQWLASLPPTFFGSIMGISGLGLAWRRAEQVLSWPSWPGDMILVIGAIILIIMLPAYGLKFLRYRAYVLHDIAHPIKGPFLAGMPLAILLQVPAIAPIHHDSAVFLYVIGAGVSFIINLYIFSSWFLLETKLDDLNAIWLIPGVGSFIVALAGIPVGFIETSWFFFSLGLVFWVWLSALLFYRYIFLPRHTDPLVPSYFVPIVPPGLISMIYPMLTGDEISGFSRVIYYFALFWLLFMLSMGRIFLRLRFAMGWWAFSFPLDTISSATIMFADAANLPLLMVFGQFLLLVTTFVIAALFIRTLWEIAKGRVFVPDTAMTNSV